MTARDRWAVLSYGSALGFCFAGETGLAIGGLVSVIVGVVLALRKHAPPTNQFNRPRRLHE
jgi:hypothetical protein